MTRRGRILQRGSESSLASGHPRSLSPRRSDLSQRSKISSQTRSPSPGLYDYTSTQTDREIVAFKALYARRRDPSNSTDDEDDDDHRPRKRSKGSSLTQPGRGIRKIIDLYHDVHDLVHKAKVHSVRSRLNPRELAEVDSVDFVGLTKDQIEEERKDRKRCHTAIQLLNQLIPGFQEKATNAESCAHFCAPYQTGANDARSDDTSRLKVVVVEWLNSRMSPNDSTSRLSAKGKEERGISNDVTGRLLCPVDYDWDNPEVRTKLRNAEPGYDIASNYFLRCLYDGEQGDPDYPEEGYLKGPLLLRAYRHIFTSPSSASNENMAATEITSRRRDVATTLRLNGRVTPRSIAYAATQLVFSLNSSREWKHEHGGLHYPSLYNFIVDFFEDAMSDDSDETTKASVNKLLEWWNGNIFPAFSKTTGGAISRHAMKSSQKRLQEARARRAHA